MTEVIEKPVITVDQFIKAYKKVHGTKPRGMDLTEWTQAELALSIRVLTTMAKGK